MSDIFMTQDGCDAKHKETVGLLTEINNRLYRDNGKKSIQTQLNEHGNVIASVQRALWIFYGAIVLAVGSGAIAIIRHFILISGG